MVKIKILECKTASVSVKVFFYFTLKTYFFQFTHLFLQNTHISLYSTHLFKKNIHSFTNFIIISSLITHLSHPTLPKKKNTKILNARATVTMHICTVTVALVHLCTILHPLMWVFFCSKCAYLNIFFYFAHTDASALKGPNENNAKCQGPMHLI